MSHIAASAITRIAAIALTFGSFPGLAGAQTVPMGGGYTNVIAIPTNAPDDVKNIAGALFKPQGAGPFPAVVYMSGCAGFSVPPEKPAQQRVIDHNLSKGIATLIVDPFTPRQEAKGVCAELAGHPELAMRGAKDARSAVNLLKLMPDIDRNRIVLQGYSYGAISVLIAASPNNPESGNLGVAGVVGYYPYCGEKSAFAKPTLILTGEKDDWTPAKLCEAIRDRPNVEVVVYPGATHGFNMPMPQPAEYLGHHMAYDEKATADAEKRVDAFLEARFRPTIDAKELRALLTRPNGWNVEMRPSSSNFDAPGQLANSGEATMTFGAEGDALVAITTTPMGTNFQPETCKRPATITGDTVTFDGCYRSGIRLRFDPTDKGTPLKGGSSRHDFTLKAK